MIEWLQLAAVAISSSTIVEAFALVLVKTESESFSFFIHHFMSSDSTESKAAANYGQPQQSFYWSIDKYLQT